MDYPQVALLSAYNKGDELRDFAKALVDLKWKLLASAGTKAFLDKHHIPSTDIGDIVGPPILGHRVVTLDRKIYAAILARPGNPEDMAELKRIGVEPISLVYVDLYPLALELSSDTCTFESVIEKTDIGGPTLLRAAAKGGCYVVSAAHQFERVLQVVGAKPGSNPFREGRFLYHFLSELAADAEETVAKYAKLSAKFRRAVADGKSPGSWHGIVTA